MNRIVLVGRLTKDPELSYTQSGIAVAKFTLAVDRPFTNQEGKREADFINCVVWRNQAESVAQYLSKGRQVAVSGRLQIRTYETKEGQRKWMTEVVCDQVKFLGSKSENAEPQDAFHEDEFGFDDVPF